MRYKKLSVGTQIDLYSVWVYSKIMKHWKGILTATWYSFFIGFVAYKVMQ